MRRGYLLLFCLLAGCTVNQSRHAVESEPLEPEAAGKVAGRVIDDFEREAAAADWTPYHVEGTVHHLRHETRDGAMHLVSDRSAGLIWRDVRLEPAEEPLVQWRWKVSRTFDASSPLAPDFDNFPARFLVGFDAGWKNAGPVALEWKRKVERATGFTPPARAICYTFGGRLADNQGVDALFGQGRIVVINLRTHREQPGRWYTEVRDIGADYRAIFNGPAPPVMAIGLGCDSHRMDVRVTADFDDITAYGPDAYAQFQTALPGAPDRHWPAAVWWVFAVCALVALGSGGAWLWMRHGPADRRRHSGQ